MRARRAFTLLELIVSMTVAGIIAVLVYGSANAGFDTRDALGRYRATAEAELRARALISDALRHATDETDVSSAGSHTVGGQRANSAAFEVVDAIDARGLPSDRLHFLTRGLIFPLGASHIWTVSLDPTASGLVIRATPANAPGESEMVARLDGVHGLEVETMSLADRVWTDGWAAPMQLPAAVRLIFLDATGAPVGLPLVVRLGLESAP